MKKFLTRLAIFSAPLLIIVFFFLYQVLGLPIDYYTFRAWEALKVYENTSLLTGPFYPNYFLKKTELGDLSGRSKIPVAKDVEWFTDSYGYRNNGDAEKKYEIVVIGDSAIAGSGLTQNDMFTEKLCYKLGVAVYPFAPTNFNQFLIDDRFIKKPPDVVIFESVEKLVLHIPEILQKDKIPYKTPRSLNGIFGKTIVAGDRLKKNAFINYVYARLSEIPRWVFTGQPLSHLASKNSQIQIPNGEAEMVFYSEPEDYFKDWQQVHIDRVVEVLKGYEAELSKRGTRLVFMPIPNKENIYWEKVNGGIPNNNLKRLIQKSREEGIETVDLLTPFKQIRSKGPDVLLYHLDDTHWNPYGVDVAVEQALKVLE